METEKKEVERINAAVRLARLRDRFYKSLNPQQKKEFDQIWAGVVAARARDAAISARVYRLK